MTLAELFNDKLSKPKEKIEILSQQVLAATTTVDDIVAFTKDGKDPVKGSCIEALEFATKQKPELITKSAFEFVILSLTEKAPRIKWESAKVIGNTAHLFPNNLETAITNLLVNSEHEGTVVRWSAAFALGEILKLKTKHTTELLSAIEAISEREEKNSIKKIYQAAIKKITK